MEATKQHQVMESGNILSQVNELWFFFYPAAAGAERFCLFCLKVQLHKNLEVTCSQNFSNFLCGAQTDKLEYSAG